MQSIRALSKKNILHAALAFALTVLAVVCTALVFDIRYEMHDDAMFCNIASGAYGPESQHLIFINILIGYAMKLLTLLHTSRNFLFLFTLAAGVLAITVLGKLLLDQAGTVRGCVVFVLALLFLGVPFFAKFCFGKYVAVLVAAGCILVWRNMGRWNGGTLLGVLLVCLGSMLRFEHYVIAGGIAAVPLAYAALTRPADERKKAFLSVAALVVLPFALWGVNYLYYYLQPAWREFLAFSTVRRVILDYRDQYFTDPSLLAGIGFSKNDYMIFSKWLGYEPTYFTTERLWDLAAVMPTNGGSLSLYTIAAMLVHFFFGSGLHLGHTILLALLIFFYDPRKVIPIIGILVTHFLMICYLCWNGRYLPRVQEIMILGASLLLLNCFRKVPFTGDGWRWPAPAAAALVLLLSLPGLAQLYRAQAAYFERNDFREQETVHLTLQKDALYLINVLSLDDMNGYHVWRAKPAGTFSNMVFVGSWLMNSPLQDDVLAAHGVIDPYRDSVDNPGVFWLEDDMYTGLKEAFIQEHYDPEARFIRLHRYPFYARFQVTTDPAAESVP